MAKQKVGHVEVPYPTAEQGLHSIEHIGGSVLGREVLPQNELIQHCWVSLGGGLGLVFPPSGPMTGPEGVAVQLSAEDKQRLEKFCAMKAPTDPKSAEAINWRAMLKVVLTILQQFIAIVLIAFLCLAAAPASAQIEQAPPVQEDIYVSIQGRSSVTGQPHPCTCGCEETGKCLCPNCNVGCGFSTAKKKQPGIIEIPFGPDGKPPHKSTQQNYGHTGLHVGGGWVHQGSNQCYHPATGYSGYWNAGKFYTTAPPVQQMFAMSGGSGGCSGGG
jgi:hypothetical protein